MSRYENENLEGLDLPDPNVTTYTDRVEGKVTCARVVLNAETGQTTYHVLCAGGQLFDPTNIDVRYKSRNAWKLRRVKKSMYDLYMKFLDTKHKTFLHQAEREI